MPLITHKAVTAAPSVKVFGTAIRSQSFQLIHDPFEDKSIIWDNDKIEWSIDPSYGLYTSKKQHESPTGDTLAHILRNIRNAGHVAPASCLLSFWIANPEYIPKELKKAEITVLFCGTTYRNARKKLCVAGFQWMCGEPLTLSIESDCALHEHDVSLILLKPDE